MAGNSSKDATLGEDGVVERRRFAPSPPCFSGADGARPPGAPLREWPVDSQKTHVVLERVAAALDRLHGFRLAHGNLTDGAVFLDAERVWFADVPAVWQDGGSPPPRERDLAWFRLLCGRLLDDADRAPPLIAARETARLILANWARSEPTRQNAAPPPTSVQPPTTLSNDPVAAENEKLHADVFPRARRSLWISGALFGFFASCGIAAAYWNPYARMAWQQVRQEVLARLPPILRNVLDPDEALEYPIDPGVGPDQFGTETPLERQLFVHSRKGFQEVLCGKDPSLTDLLERMLSTPDPNFHSALAAMFNPLPGWAEEALPRLRELLDRPIQSETGKWALEAAFLRTANRRDLDRVYKLAASDRTPTVLDAHWALARLGKPTPTAEIVRLADKNVGDSRTGYIRLALRYYTYQEIQPLIQRYLFNEAGRPTETLFEFAVTLAGPSGTGDPPRVAVNVLRMLDDLLPRILDRNEPTTDCELVKTLICFAHIWQISPEAMFARFKLDARQSDRLRSRLTRILVEEGFRTPLAASWRVPDSWYATALAWSGRYPAAYIRDSLSPPRVFTLQPADVIQQSRLLALANLRRPEIVVQIHRELIRRLELVRDQWTAEQTHLAAVALTLLAASESAPGRTFLEDFFRPGALGRDPTAWEGFVVGATLSPAANRSLLQVAAEHPFRTIRWRAADALALADGDVQRLRSARTDLPAVPAELAPLIERLRTTTNENDAQFSLTGERDWLLTELALGLAGSRGANAVLNSRADRRDAPHITYTLIANLPTPMDFRRFDQFIHREPPNLLEEPQVLLGFTVHNDGRLWEDMIWLATGENAGRATPPLLHRATALYALGALARAGNAMKGVDGEVRFNRRQRWDLVKNILGVIDRDPSLVVQHSAAVAALKIIDSEDKDLLRKHRLARVDLPVEIRSVLALADKL